MSRSIIVTGASGFLGCQLVSSLSESTTDEIWAIDKVVQSHSKKINFVCTDLSSSSSIDNFVVSMNNLHGSNILIYHAASLNPTAKSLSNDTSSSDILHDCIQLIPCAINIELVGLLQLISSLRSRDVASIDIVWLNSIYGVTSPIPELYEDIGLNAKPIHYPVVKHAAIALSEYLNALDLKVPVTIKSVILDGISSGRESQAFKESYFNHMRRSLLDPEVVLSKLLQFSQRANIDSSIEYIVGPDV